VLNYSFANVCTLFVIVKFISIAFLISHACYTSRPSHSPLFYHPNNVWRTSFLLSPKKNHFRQFNAVIRLPNFCVEHTDMMTPPPFHPNGAAKETLGCASSLTYRSCTRIRMCVLNGKLQRRWFKCSDGRFRYVRAHVRL